MRSPNGREQQRHTGAGFNTGLDGFIDVEHKKHKMKPIDLAEAVVRRFIDGKADDEDKRILRDCCKGEDFIFYSLGMLAIPIDNKNVKSDQGSCICHAIMQNLIAYFQAKES